MFKLNKLAVTLAVAAFSATSAQAAFIDPFGLGGAGGNYDVFNLGWNNGNAISVPIQTANGTVNNTVVDNTIQTYGHAKLQGLNDLDGNSFVINNFNPNTWSYVFGFAEEVVAANDVGETASRDFRVINGGNNFFEIWVGGSVAVDLSGRGFQGDGGAVRILAGTVLPYNLVTGDGQTSFTSSSSNLVNLDQALPNNYTDNATYNYQTVTGVGGGKIDVEVTDVNSDYFLEGLNLISVMMVTDTFQNLPFQQVNPSSCFWDGSAYFSGAGNGITNGCGTAGDGGTVGLANGVFYGDYNGNPAWTNTMFQTRATTVLPAGQIPEPATLALLGLGLFGLGALRRKAA